MVFRVARRHSGGIFIPVLGHIHHTIRRLCGKSHMPTIVRDEHHISPPVGALFISLLFQNRLDGLERCVYGWRVPHQGSRPADHTADSNVLNVLEMPAREEGEEVWQLFGCNGGEIDGLDWMPRPRRNEGMCWVVQCAFLWWLATQQSVRPPHVSPLHFSTSIHRTDAWVLVLLEHP